MSFESFYGGRIGASFVIKKYFDGINLPNPSYKAKMYAYQNIDNNKYYLVKKKENVIGESTDYNQDYDFIERTTWNYTSYSWDRVVLDRVTSLNVVDVDNSSHTGTKSIEKAFAEGMVQCFEKGGDSTDEVNYGEYVIIDTIAGLNHKNDPDNGKVFRRGINFAEGDLHGAEYIGQIVGPQGETPEVDMNSFNYIVSQAEGHASTGSYNMTDGMVPGKDSLGNYHDEIRYAYYNMRDADDNIQQILIGFEFPYLVVEFTGNTRSPYYQAGDVIPTGKSVGDLLLSDFELSEHITESPEHPFYDKWKINIPKGIKGDSLDTLEAYPTHSKSGVKIYDSTGTDTHRTTEDEIAIKLSGDAKKVNNNTFFPLINSGDYIRAEDGKNYRFRYKETKFDNKQNGVSEYVDAGLIVYITDIKIDTGTSEGAGTQRVQVKYSNENEYLPIGDPLNYIVDTYVVPLDTQDPDLQNIAGHLLVYYSDPQKREASTIPNIIIKGRIKWVDIGDIGYIADAPMVIGKFDSWSELSSKGSPENIMHNDPTYKGWGAIYVNGDTEYLAYYDYRNNPGTPHWEKGVPLGNDIKLSQLTDVGFNNPQNGDVVTYNNGTWINGKGILNLEDLNNVDFNSLITGDVLRYNGTSWTNGEAKDEKVKQSPDTTDANYEILFSGSANNTESIEEVKKDTGLRYNPSLKSIMEGANTSATGDSSHAEGYYTSANGRGSHTEGYSASQGYIIANNTGAHAEGYSGVRPIIANGRGSHAEGYQTSAIGNYSHAEGNSTCAVNTGSHAEGYQTSAIGSYSHAEGYLTCASGDNSHAEGENTVASISFPSQGEHHIVSVEETTNYIPELDQIFLPNRPYEGLFTTSYYSIATVESVWNDEIMIHSVFNEGDRPRYYQMTLSITNEDLCFENSLDNCEVSLEVIEYSNYSIEMRSNDTIKILVKETGEQINKINYISFFININGDPIYGQNNFYDAKLSFTLNIVAQQEGSDFPFMISFGGSSRNYVPIVIHYYSFYDIDFDYYKNCHAEGDSTTAAQDSAHAEGVNTLASGYASHAEGIYTIAEGNYSHAEGVYTIAEGPYSHAEGYRTTAKWNYQHVQGKYNANKGTTLFEIGNGTATTACSNAFEVYNDGKFSQDNGTTKFKFTQDSNGDKGYIDENNEFHRLVGVEQTPTSIDANYEILFSASPNNNSEVNGIVRKDTGLRYNPSKQSIMEGSQTYAVGEYSHAEGEETTALRADSHAEGYRTCAAGFCSHAEGWGDQDYYVIASGRVSHAEGGATTAGGEYSHAEGYGSYASNDYSFAGGNEGSTRNLEYTSSIDGESSSANYKNFKGTSIFALGGDRNFAGSMTQAVTQYYEWADKSLNNVFNIDNRGNIFSAGSHILTCGYINGCTTASLQPGAPHVRLECGAMYRVCAIGQKTDKSFLGAASYLIATNFDLDNNYWGCGSESVATPKIGILGSAGTMPVKLVPTGEFYLSTGSYYPGLTIAAAATNYRVRWSITKISGSIADFGYEPNFG